MELRYNVTGAERKRLVSLICETTGEPMRYLGAPTFGYAVGPFTVDRVGTLEYDNSVDAQLVERVVTAARENGFIAEGETPIETAEPAEQTEDTEPTEQAEQSYEAEYAEPAQTDESPEETEVTNAHIGEEIETPHAELPEEIKAEPPSEQPSPPVESLIVSFPRNLLDDGALENLRKLIASKETLIKRALGVDALPIEVTEQAVGFPWFEGWPQPDEVNAYTRFICKLLGMAAAQKRITAVDKPVENEKYAFRCFLLRLGFIGSEFKDSRRILLKNFSGSSAFKSGARTAGNEADDE